ncbi:MAG: SCP2 sterol-binding domain-containing protein [archaeon]|nr:SCP2 sterol-binding domain-containing protein [archaeon]
MMRSKIQSMIDKFCRKVEKDEKIRKEIEIITKTVNIDLGEETYNFKLEHAQIAELSEGLSEKADITLKTTPENLNALIEGTLRPMKAYITKKIIVKGKIDDIMHLRNLF